MTQGRYNRTALVLSGGGARAAYEVGVLKALRELLRQPERSPFSMYCGTSAGALNAASLALTVDDFAAGVDALVALWSGMRTDRIYKTTPWNAAAVGWLPGTRPQALFDNAPLADLLSGQFDFGRLDAAIATHSLRALCITCSGFSSGQTVAFFQGRPDLDPWRGTQRVGAHVSLSASHVLASMATPFLFPAVKLHREYFGDASVRDSAPLSPAVRLGGDRLVVIASGATARNAADESEERPNVDHPPSLASTIGQVLSGPAGDPLGSDVQRMADINRLLARIPESVREREKLRWRPMDLLVLQPSQRLEVLAAELVGELPWPARSVLRSMGANEKSADVLISYLLFEPIYTQKLIDLGYADTMLRRGEVADFFADQPR